MANNTLWSLLVSVISFLPWLVISAAAGIALMRTKNSIPLWLEVVGGSLCFAFGVLRWVVVFVLNWMSASYNVVGATHTIFNFLLFMALVTFAIGFCLQTLSRKKEGAGFPVVATPVETK